MALPRTGESQVVSLCDRETREGVYDFDGIVLRALNVFIKRRRRRGSLLKKDSSEKRLFTFGESTKEQQIRNFKIG